VSAGNKSEAVETVVKVSMRARELKV